MFHMSGDASAVMLLEQVSHLSRYHAMKRMEALDMKPGQAGILFILLKLPTSKMGFAP